MLSDMKWQWILLVLAILLPSCEKSEVKTPAPAEKTLITKTSVETSAVEESGEAGVNQRFRPSHRPEPRKYLIPKPEPVPYPVAVAVEGSPGYVTSPYSDKIVDVRGIPGGTLVQDPMFPASDKKYFRVPEE
jgi:hypothetical protein